MVQTFGSWRVLRRRLVCEAVPLFWSVCQAQTLTLPLKTAPTVAVSYETTAIQRVRMQHLIDILAPQTKSSRKQARRTNQCPTLVFMPMWSLKLQTAPRKCVEALSKYDRHSRWTLKLETVGAASIQSVTWDASLDAPLSPPPVFYNVSQRFRASSEMLAQEKCKRKASQTSHKATLFRSSRQAESLAAKAVSLRRTLIQVRHELRDSIEITIQLDSRRVSF